MYIGDYAGRRALYSPDALAVVDAGKQPELRLTFTDLDARATRLAAYLRAAAGVTKGQRVAILAHDGVEHLDLFCACGKLGAIHTGLNWRLHWREQLAILRDVTPSVVLHGSAFADRVAELQRADTSVTTWIHLDGEGIAAGDSSSVAYRAIFDRPPPTEPLSCEDLEAEDVAALLFTGGTTGLPKGAKISHRQIAWNAYNTVIHDLTHRDVYLNVFPMFHAGGLFAYSVAQLILGGRLILVQRFDPDRVLELIERERVTVFAGVPAMYQMMTQAPSWADADLGSLRFCTSGGAPLPVPLVQQYAAEKGVRFKQGFGMTEFGPGVFALPAEDAERKAGSIGRPNFFVDARVVDDHGAQLGPGEIGKLVLKGPSICSGYFNRPDEWAAVIDQRGWFHTGDMARYDEEHYYYIVDRKKDMFISGGENVFPVEVEAALYRHPAVHQCAVVGVADARWGEVGRAFVVLKPGADATAEQLVAHCADHLARFKVPKTVEIVESLPISAAGKILRRELKARPT